MNEPKRYTGKTEGSVLGSPHWEHPEGEWVKWEDYALLKAEVERLTKAGDAMAEELVRLEAAFNGIESAQAQIWYIAKEGGCP
jgi:hypothetical protein